MDKNEGGVILTYFEMGKLIETLQDAKLQIEYLHEKFQPTGSGNSVLNNIETVLKNYENF